MKYSKGIFWLDDTRIPFVDSDWESAVNKRKSFVKTGGGYQNLYVGGLLENPIDTLKSIKQQGRFTPNLLVSDDALNDGNIGISSGRPPKGKSIYGRASYNQSKTVNTQDNIEYGDKGSNSRYYDIDLWFKDLIEKL
jgi:hypothetical protein